MELIEEIRRALDARERTPLAPGPVPAAVLVPLFFKDGEYRVLFTKRTSAMTHHSGEISFPGGVAEPEDLDSVDTALRETWEEIGIPKSLVQVLGSLDDFVSAHNYLVTPIVGLIPADHPLAVSDREIERIIEVPLSHFTEPHVLRTEQQLFRGAMRTVYYYSYNGDEIWGLTARIMKQLLDILAEIRTRF